jgi:glucose-6-phosphate dehydrogenase assembly protein OpcA
MSQGEDFRKGERREGWAVPLDAVAAFTQGASVSVAPERIEQELLSLWRRASERAQAKGAAFAVTRACQWNLIVHTHGEVELLAAKQIIDMVTESVPCRVIFLHETEEASDGGLIGDDGAPLRASVEANFRDSQSGRREIVAEEITIETPQLHSRRLPGLLRALLLPDVPTALLVGNPARDVEWLRPICGDADRFVFDSGRLSGFAELGKVAKVLDELYGGSMGSVERMDIGWLRLWPWRLLLSSLYDAPESRAGLSSLREIVVRYVPGGEAAALLLAGWLIGRLRLVMTGTLAEDGSAQLLPGAGSAVKCPVQLRLGLCSQGRSPTGLVEVALLQGDASLSAAVCADGSGILLSSPFQPPRTQPMRGRPDAELWVAALGVGGRDPLMYEALRLGAALLLGDEIFREQQQPEVRW